MQNDGLEQL